MVAFLDPTVSNEGLTSPSLFISHGILREAHIYTRAIDYQLLPRNRFYVIGGVHVHCGVLVSGCSSDYIHAW
jgi:hypothetical protein